MSFSAKSSEPPFAAEGGIPAQPLADGDPYRALDDLMAVVEQLCPAWPARKAGTAADKMLL